MFHCFLNLKPNEYRYYRYDIDIDIVISLTLKQAFYFLESVDFGTNFDCCLSYLFNNRIKYENGLQSFNNIHLFQGYVLNGTCKT